MSHVLLTCKCDGCIGAASMWERRWAKDATIDPPTFGCNKEPLIDPVMFPIHCVHCGSDDVDLGVTGLHMCRKCGGLFREQDRPAVEARDRQHRIEESLR